MKTRTLTEQKREDILKAALNEFDARGFRETSMDRIAETAKVSKRTVYNHFASKDGLFEAIADELSRRVQMVTGHRYDPDRPIDEQLRRIGEHMMDMLAAPVLSVLPGSPWQRCCVRRIWRARPTSCFASASRGWRSGCPRPRRRGGCGVCGPGVGRRPVFRPDQIVCVLAADPGGQPAPDAPTRSRILDSSVDLFLRSYLPR